MSKNISIDGRLIGADCLPYMIAEMSANHNGDIKNAYKIIDMAKNAGADAVKMQTYTADTLTLDSDLPDFQLNEGLWAGRSLHNLYQEAHTPWNWHKDLFGYAKKIGITMFSSPFDNSAVDLLENLNAPAYKVASFEAIDLPLIKYIAATKKPMIISTGMANLEEITEAIDAAKSGGCDELAILHCVSGYPAPPGDYNLKTLMDMQERFGLVTGLSDHTLDNITAISSVALGASIIEKHVTLDRNGGGPDDSFSLESDGLTELCANLKVAWQSQGCIDYGRKSSEGANNKFRRSLYIAEDIESGETFTEKNIRSIRPGYGLPPKYFEQILGKKCTYAVKKGIAANWTMVDSGS